MLNALDRRLAEAHGLAIAAEVVTARVAERIGDASLLVALDTMNDDAEETRARCQQLEQKLPPETLEELHAHLNSTRFSAADLVGAWFKAGTDPQRAWSFLAMSEAGEVATWSALSVLAERAGSEDVAELAAWALPLQRRHLALALDGATRLA